MTHEWQDKMFGCYNPYWRKVTTPFGNFDIPCPCGKCINCLRQYQKQWSLRMRQEKADAKSSFFLTLTLNNEALIYGDFDAILYKPQYQNFLKRVRKKLSKIDCHLRYVVVGEYGGRTNRPHFHMAIYLDKTLKLNEFYFICKSSWDSFIELDYLKSERIKYLTKYFNKLDERWHEVKPFRNMSNGIGRGYLTLNAIRYHKKNLTTQSHKFGFTVSLPRYYRHKIFGENVYAKALFLKRFENDYRDWLEGFVSRHGNVNPYEHYSENNKRALERSKVDFISFCDDDRNYSEL